MRFKILVISLLAVVFSGCASNNTKPSASAEVKTESSTPAANVQKVKGLHDIDGEIVGTPAAGSKFNELKIGMSIQQVKNILGDPSDQDTHETGKRWIPFYYGDDARRTEWIYKGLGRLTFASDSVFGGHQGALIRITHNPNESGTR